MAVVQPTLAVIRDQLTAAFRTNLGIVALLVPKSALYVIATAVAGVWLLLYKYNGFLALQPLVKYASFDPITVNGITFSPLIELGRQIDVGDPTEATQAELLIDITVNTTGGTLATNTQLVGTNNGVTYITTGAVALSAATVQATIRAVDDQEGGGGRGVIGNLQAADTVSFVNPLATINQTAVVDSQVTTGAAAEDTEVYRTRVADRWRKRLQGGAYSDYEAWGLAVAGIISVFPYTGDPGEVDVYSEATVASSGSPDGIPTAAQLTAVLDYINDQDATAGKAQRRNATAFVNSLPITRTGFTVNVVGIATVDDLAQVQTDITTALTEFFLASEPFIPGLAFPPRKDQMSRTRISAIVEDIVTAAGGTFTSSSFYVTSGGAASLPIYILGEGEKAKLDTVVFS